MNSFWVRSFLIWAFLTSPVSAATRLDFPSGGYYSDATPARAYAVLIQNSHIETNRGRVELPFPGNNLLQLRISHDGLRFAGHGHHDGLAWEWSWTTQRWQDYGVAFGVNSIIYDGQDRLVVVRESDWPITGSQGYRYVNDAGVLVPAYITYADAARQIWEYTTRQLSIGSVTCGQGAVPQGLHCIINGRRVLVAGGDCRFAHFNATGDALAFSYANLPALTSTLIWMTAKELQSLPTVDTTPPEPTPTPTPDPEPTPPTPPQDRLLPEAVLQSLKDERARCPQPGLACAARVLNFAAWTHRNEGWGLYPKTGGTVCQQPITNMRISCDILIWKARGLWFDVLGDSEGQTVVPAHPPVGEPVGDPFFVTPVKPPDTEPEPTPEPQPPSDDWKPRVEALEKAVSAMFAANAELERRVTALEQKPDNGVPEARVLALIDAAFSQAYAVGTTSKDWGHSHRINIKVLR